MRVMCVPSQRRVQVYFHSGLHETNLEEAKTPTYTCAFIVDDMHKDVVCKGNYGGNAEGRLRFKV